MQVWELKQALSELDDDTLEVFIYGDGGMEGDTGTSVKTLEGEFIRFHGFFTGRALVIS